MQWLRRIALPCWRHSVEDKCDRLPPIQSALGEHTKGTEESRPYFVRSSTGGQERNLNVPAQLGLRFGNDWWTAGAQSGDALRPWWKKQFQK